MNEISQTTVEIKSDKKKKLSSVSGSKCCLPHCGKSKRSDPNLKIFRFPYLDTLLLKVWLEKCNIEKHILERAQILYICEKHFLADCIGKKYLKRGSVPTLNLPEKNEDVTFIKKENSFESEDANLSLVTAPPCKPNPSLCTKCHKMSKNDEFYRIKYLNTFKRLKAANGEKRALKIKNESFKRRLKTLEKKLMSKKSIEFQIDNLDISQNEKTFCKMLIKKKRGTDARWNDHETTLAQSIFHKSHATYLFLRNKLNLNLPSTASLSRWNRNRNLQPDNNLNTNDTQEEFISSDLICSDIKTEDFDMENLQSIVKVEFF